MGAGVHAQAASTTTEAVALGAILAGVAVLAKEFSFVLSAVGRVEQFAAETYKENSSSKNNLFLKNFTLNIATTAHYK